VQRVSATRTELLARRTQIGLARQGRDLLEDKRQILVKELTQLAEQGLQGASALEELAVEGRGALGDGNAFDGPEQVASAALAATGAVELEVERRNVAGVELVEIVKQPVARPVTRRGYSLAATSARVDRIAELHERLLDELLDAVGVELSMRRLAEEIQRTARRVNALEHVVIPRLEDERRYIALVLDEREREDRTRLRRAKAR